VTIRFPIGYFLLVVFGTESLALSFSRYWAVSVLESRHDLSESRDVTSHVADQFPHKQFPIGGPLEPSLYSYGFCDMKWQKFFVADYSLLLLWPVHDDVSFSFSSFSVCRIALLPCLITCTVYYKTFVWAASCWLLWQPVAVFVTMFRILMVNCSIHGDN